MVANPRCQHVARVASSRCEDWSSSSPSRVGSGPILRRSDHIFAFVTEDLEGFVQDRSKLREDQAATNATTFLMLDLRFRDARPMHFPIDFFPCRLSRVSGQICENTLPAPCRDILEFSVIGCGRSNSSARQATDLHVPSQHTRQLTDNHTPAPVHDERPVSRRGVWLVPDVPRLVLNGRCANVVRCWP